jgi:two-component sensor histidine kinase
MQGTPFARDVPELEWENLASGMGRVGRWALYPAEGISFVDAPLRELMNLPRDSPKIDAAADVFPRIHPDDLSDVEAKLATAIETGNEYAATFRFERTPGEFMWVVGKGRTTKDRSGNTVLIGVNYDVTELRDAQDRAELLAGEMRHRIKNVFALIQAMFNMAARSSKTKEDLVDSFSGRLQALTAVNELTFAGHDRDVPLAEIAVSLLGPLIEAGQIRADVMRGFRLSGAAAQTVTLALNELLTNATKHGALRPGGGDVDLSMRVVDGVFVLRWREQTTAPITPPADRTGFGMRVLMDMTRATFDGEPQLDWRSDGLTFTCTWPLGGFGQVADAG